jgi:hypothetical protein
MSNSLKLRHYRGSGAKLMRKGQNGTNEPEIRQ